MTTLSIVKGKGNLKHNNRTIKNQYDKSWDSDLSYKNIKFIDKTLEEAYEDIFTEALENYNQKQIEKNHSERVIDNYLEKIQRSKQEKPFYELVISIGDCDEIKKDSIEEKKAIKALCKYVETFQSRNPNMIMFNCHLHNDEKGVPHVHLDYIPIAKNQKRGLETRVSMGLAMQQQGYNRNGFAEWRENEQKAMIEIMKSHDFEYTRGSGRKNHLSVKKYKEEIHEIAYDIDLKRSEREQIENDIEYLRNQKKVLEGNLDAYIEKLGPVDQPKMKKSFFKTKVEFTEKEFDDYKKYMVAQLTKLTNENNTLRKENNRLIKENNNLHSKIQCLTNELAYTTQYIIDVVKEYSNKLLETAIQKLNRFPMCDTLKNEFKKVIQRDNDEFSLTQYKKMAKEIHKKYEKKHTKKVKEDILIR